MSDQGQFDETAAQDAGYAAGRVEGDYDRTGQDLSNDVQAVENVPGEIASDSFRDVSDGVRDVTNIPSDVGDAISGAAEWVGDKIGGVEGDERRAQNDVDQFGNNVDQSYDQGEQQGRQQGGW